MKAYRDTHSPLEGHTIVFDRVRLTFGEGGLLRDPDADELAVMTANPLRRARFVEVDVPTAKSASGAAPAAEAHPATAAPTPHAPAAAPLPATAKGAAATKG